MIWNDLTILTIYTYEPHPRPQHRHPKSSGPSATLEVAPTFKSMRQRSKKCKNDFMLRCLGQSYLNIYVPMPPCTVTPMIHVAESLVIRQSKQPLPTPCQLPGDVLIQHPGSPYHIHILNPRVDPR